MPNLKPWSTLCAFALLTQLVIPVAADGVGVLGGGKWLYKPACAHACRSVIANNEIACDAKDADSEEHAHTKRHHPAANTVECLLKDAAFIRTLALCIDQRCVQDDKVPMSVVEEYWEGHVGTGSVGDWSPSMQPAMLYHDALTAAKHDIEEMGEGNVPTTKPKASLMVTSLISDEDYMPRFRGNQWFDDIEKNHGRNSIAVAVSTVAIPILASLLRFLPGRPLWYSRLVNVLDVPVIGHRHRVPLAGDAGIMPTRAQALYLVYPFATQILLSIFPLAFLYPNNISSTASTQVIRIIGCRTGILGMADFVALFLFSSRNNPLLWITDWSHSTFLLLHRWIAYCAVFQVCFHSMLMLPLYWPDHATESKLPYWIWGIVGTLLFVVMWPLAILPVRKKAYEFFLASHQVLAALALIATFFHIFELFKYKWGYEIWVYIGGGIWFFERFLRVIRMVSNGTRTAVVTSVDPDAEYIRVEVDGIVASGHVYAYFPTLSWRVWENHPLSVLSTFTSVASSTSINEKSDSDIDLKAEPDHTHSLEVSREIQPRVTLLIRPVTGTTQALATRLRASGGHLSLPIILESSYHANGSVRDLEHCSTLLCIAGGVGITAVVPILKSFGGARAKLVWSMRNEWALRAVRPELDDLKRRSVEVETRVGGERLSMMDVVRDELQREGVHSDLGIVVCGPAGMADDVRAAVGQLGPRSKRGVVFIDEAFSW
ncbi:metalloreductase [Coprinopsis sp. MPI-PUGE-AT-0042]|nr:metalloreductase [Coprinopsis sp. MPI-PUGE-AT-0042]